MKYFESKIVILIDLLRLVNDFGEFFIAYFDEAFIWRLL